MSKDPEFEHLAGWDAADCGRLIDELWAVRRAMLDNQRRLAPWLQRVDPAQQASAVNLAHYLAMRRHDLRQLQQRLGALGLSSLGRAETHALANLDKVLGILHRLADRPWTPMQEDEPAGFRGGPALLARNAGRLLGDAPAERRVRIMVTLPSQAAHDAGLVDTLVDAGMDIARINCAHDDAIAWVAMAERVRAAGRRAGRPVRVLMDLGGPKLRTGAVEGGPAVLKLQPRRDVFGRVLGPWYLHLRGTGPVVPVAADASLAVDPEWLAGLSRGDRIEFTDARAAHRVATVVEAQPDAVRVEGEQTAYLVPGTRLRAKGHGGSETTIEAVSARPGAIHLQRGQRVRLQSHGVGHDAASADGHSGRLAAIACTLPEALEQVRKGDQVWFDDGKIGAVVLRKTGKAVELEITNAREGGDRLAADKGINLPDTALDLPALTDKDMQDLVVVARHADLVGLSFANRARDVHMLRAELHRIGAGNLGLLLKIETRAGFEHLPELLLAALCGPTAGVMIARGDLAVECGFERLAEIQEEILWACEAAHLPVVWATQVLETMAKTGRPSRAEVTDAAMGERAECVMLNKGPHIVDAMRTLDDILRRMQSHQSKKSSLLRALKAWRSLPEPPAPAT